MAPANDRDPVMDDLLSHALSGRPAGVSACVDAETMAAWVERTLPSSAAAQVEEHVSSCSRCQAVMATFVRSAPAPAPVESLWKRWQLGWLVPIAGTAAAIAIYVASRPPAEQAPESVQSRVEIAEEPRSVTVPETPATSAPPASTSAEVRREARADDDSSLKAAPSPSAAAQENVAREQPQAQTFQQRVAPEIATLEARRPEVPVPADLPAPVPPRPAAAAPTTARAAGAVAARALSASAPLEVRSASAAERWRIAGDGSVERSVDSGATWQSTGVPVSGGIRAGSSPAAGICWLVGSGGVVWVTTDGVRFTRVQFPQAVDLSAVVATSSRSATVTGADGRTFRTDDQGATWQANP